MFTVVVPLYNKESSIKATLESVLLQKTQEFEFEVIIVNDGSTDKSVSVLENINSPRVRIINQRNKGVSAARNRGVMEARYEWIAFIDGDDLWMENHLLTLKEMITMFPNEKVFVSSFKYSDSVIQASSEKNLKPERISNYFERAIKERLIWTGALVVHKSCFLIAGNFDTRLCRGEDLDMWARLAKHFSIIKGNKYTAVYNVHVEDSLSKGKSKYIESRVSLISLNNIQSYERKYYKKIIFSRILSELKEFNLCNVFKILLKHNVELFK